MDENVLWISCVTKNFLRRENIINVFFEEKVWKSIVFSCGI